MERAPSPLASLPLESYDIQPPSPPPTRLPEEEEDIIIKGVNQGPPTLEFYLRRDIDALVTTLRDRAEKAEADLAHHKDPLVDKLLAERDALRAEVAELKTEGEMLREVLLKREDELAEARRALEGGGK